MDSVLTAGCREEQTRTHQCSCELNVHVGMQLTPGPILAPVA